MNKKYLMYILGLVVVVIVATIYFLQSEERDNSVGIFFKDGTECLGEYAGKDVEDEIYVSPDGSDENSGSSKDEPLQTLAYSLCNLHPGQTLYVLPGTYYESVVLGEFGVADNEITIEGVKENGEIPILDGLSQKTMGIALVESTNIIVKNLRFENYTDQGLYVLSSGDINIVANEFVNNGRASQDPEAEEEGFGVNVVGSGNVLIEDNLAEYNGPNEERVKSGVLGTGINTYELTDSIIRNNISRNNTGGGILIEDSTQVLIEKNEISQNQLDAGGDYWDGGIWVDGGKFITLKDNAITDNFGPGIEISDEDVQYPNASKGYILQGNTISGNTAGLYIWNYGVCEFPTKDVLIFADDNVLENNSEGDIWCEEWECGENQACD